MAPFAAPKKISPELVSRYEQVWAQWQRARVGCLQQQPGNPLGAAAQQFGTATALRAVQAPSSVWLNRVLHLGDADVDHAEALVAFYKEHSIRPILELPPGLASEPILERLSELGARQTGFHTVTHGVPSADEPPLPPGVTVTEVGPEELDLWISVYLEGNENSPSAAASVRRWYGLPGWHFYLARVDGVPAGTALLTVTDGVGYMAAAATLHSLRGRGCQGALLRRRSAEAARLGCDLIMGQCSFGSISHQNQERAGLRTAYTKALYTLQ